MSYIISPNYHDRNKKTFFVRERGKSPDTIVECDSVECFGNVRIEEAESYEEQFECRRVLVANRVTMVPTKKVIRKVVFSGHGFKDKETNESVDQLEGITLKKGKIVVPS